MKSESIKILNHLIGTLETAVEVWKDDENLYGDVKGMVNKSHSIANYQLKLLKKIKENEVNL